MAQITLNIPDHQTQRVLNALCTAGDYNSEVDGTRVAFAKAMVIRWVRDTTLAVERAERERAALVEAGSPDPLDDIT